MKSAVLNIQRNPEFGSVLRLLAECSLPVADLTPGHLEHFLGCKTEQTLAGIVGMEMYGNTALLRSLAVAANSRGNGYGTALVHTAERHAQSLGVTQLYLLTDTAEQFFERLGYCRADRESAPEAIRQTREFSSLCPASSAFMTKMLVETSIRIEPSPI